MTTATRNTQTIVIETSKGSFYLKKQEIKWEGSKPVVQMKLTKSKTWALKTDHLTKEEIIRQIHAAQPEGVSYAH